MITNETQPYTAMQVTLVIHRGRRSGRTFQTPLWAFRRQNKYVIALTYGSNTDWVRNVLAAGGCELIARRSHYTAGAPRVYRDPTAAQMPPVIRFLLRRVITASEFLSPDLVDELPTRTAG